MNCIFRKTLNEWLGPIRKPCRRLGICENEEAQPGKKLPVRACRKGRCPEFLSRADILAGISSEPPDARALRAVVATFGPDPTSDRVREFVRLQGLTGAQTDSGAWACLSVRAPVTEKDVERALERGKEKMGTADMPKITFLLLNYKRPDNLPKVVASIRKQEGVESRIILVDNGDGSLKDPGADLLIVPKGNLGCYARWASAAFDIEVPCQWYCTLDDDWGFKDSSVMRDAVALAETNPDVDLFGPRGVRIEKPGAHYRKCPHIDDPTTPQEVDIVKGRMMLVRRRGLEKLPLLACPEAKEDDIAVSAALAKGKGPHPHLLLPCFRGRMEEFPAGKVGMESRPDHYHRRDRALKHFFGSLLREWDNTHMGMRSHTVHKGGRVEVIYPRIEAEGLPEVACICPSSRELERSVALFGMQTYPCRKLVIMMDAGDDRKVSDKRIQQIFIRDALPEHRAMQILLDASSRAKYVAHWLPDAVCPPPFLADSVYELEENPHSRGVVPSEEFVITGRKDELGRAAGSENSLVYHTRFAPSPAYVEGCCRVLQELKEKKRLLVSHEKTPAAGRVPRGIKAREALSILSARGFIFKQEGVYSG